jgi:hypothetical protein
MTVTAFANSGEPEHGRSDPELETLAGSTVSGWLHARPAVAGELKETIRAHTHVQELRRRADDAASAAEEAEEHAASRTTKLDPAGHRVLGLLAGTGLVVLLIVLDSIPLSWAAQAFGLDAAGSWLVTAILLVASIGAMVGFEVTHDDARRRALLATVTAGAYIALVVLRTQFLTTVSGASVPAAVLQSVLLSVISAGLVLCGSAVMARTRPLSLARARAAARRAQQAAAATRAAVRNADDRMQRHLGSLHQMLIPWALGSVAPDGVDHASWAAALDRAVRALFPGP